LEYTTNFNHYDFYLELASKKLFWSKQGVILELLNVEKARTLQIILKRISLIRGIFEALFLVC